VKFRLPFDRFAISADPSREHVARVREPSRFLCPTTTAQGGRALDFGPIADVQELVAPIVELPLTLLRISRLTPSSNSAGTYGCHPVWPPR
jgi:hypothetical protein